MVLNCPENRIRPELFTISPEFKKTGADQLRPVAL